MKKLFINFIVIFFIIFCSSTRSSSLNFKLGSHYVVNKNDTIETYESLFGIDSCKEYKIYSNFNEYTVETKNNLIVNYTIFQENLKMSMG